MELVHIKCELIGGGALRHLNTFSNLFIVAVHYTHININYVLLTVPMYTMLPTTNHQNISYLVVIVDCTNVGSATASLEDIT